MATMADHESDVAEIRYDANLSNTGGKIATPTTVYSTFGNPPKTGMPQYDLNGDVVVIRDSDIDHTHPIFKNIPVEKPDISGLPTDGKDTVGHGTAVAGAFLLGASSVKKIISVPIFGDKGRTSFENIKRSYDWILNNNSGIDKVVDSWGAPRKIQRIDGLQNKLEQTGAEGYVAAGNTDQRTGSPATAERAYAIAAVRLTGDMARFSSPTDNISMIGVDVAVPASSDADVITGPKVPSKKRDGIMNEIGGEWLYLPGTSFANPYAAGYANSWQHYVAQSPNIKTDLDADTDVEVVFEKTANDVKGTGEDGKGYIDLEAAMKKGRPDEGTDDTVTGTAVPLFDKDILYLSGDVLESGTYGVDVEMLDKAMWQK